MVLLISSDTCYFTCVESKYCMQWQCLFRCLELFDLLDEETCKQFESFKMNTFRHEDNMVVPQLDSNLEA